MAIDATSDRKSSATEPLGPGRGSDSRPGPVDSIPIMAPKTWGASHGFGAAGVVSAGFEWQSGGETWNKATALRHFLAAWLVTSRCGYGAAQGCMQTRSLLPSARKHA